MSTWSSFYRFCIKDWFFSKLYVKFLPCADIWLCFYHLKYCCIYTCCLNGPAVFTKLIDCRKNRSKKRMCFYVSGAWTLLDLSISTFSVWNTKTNGYLTFLCNPLLYACLFMSCLVNISMAVQCISQKNKVNLFVPIAACFGKESHVVGLL